MMMNTIDTPVHYPLSDERVQVELRYRISNKAREAGLHTVFNRFFQSPKWHTLGVYRSVAAAKKVADNMLERTGELFEYQLTRKTEDYWE